MRIETFRVKNFKSHLDTGLMSLSPGMNLIVGRNSVGKSALLEALERRGVGLPHKSLRSQPHPDDPLDPTSTVELQIGFIGRQLRQVVMGANNSAHFPWPIGRVRSEASIREIIEEIFASRAISARLVAPANVGSGFTIGAAARPNLTWIYGQNETSFEHENANFSVTPDRRGFTNCRMGVSGPDLASYAAAVLQKGLFRFDAERIGVGSCALGQSTRLSQNASNLPEVLAQLATNPARFERYQQLVKQVLPVVQGVSVKPTGNGNGEIRVWQLPRDTERDDLAFPLSQCGTGISQVLAILYVTSASGPEDPQTILIDEPNSFLHPGAARSLIGVLRGFPHHQYVIATHATEVIAAAGACPVISIDWDDGVSRCELVPQRTTDVSRKLLQDVGARLSDVFGFDRVLWVEGPSDEACVRALLEACFDPQVGLAILPVRDTGSFERRKAAGIVAIYKQASMASALIPPTVGFLLDRESRTDRDLEEIMRETNGAVSFYDRRMLENYLLDVGAIVALIASVDSVAPAVVGEHDVRAWLDMRGRDAEYGAANHPVMSGEWLRSVNGARIMSNMISSLTEARCEFSKVVHCEALTRLILNADPATLEPLTLAIEQKLGIQRRQLG